MASGGNGSGGDNREPRQPHNLQGLLKFCTEHTGQEDATGESGLQEPMSAERRQWLQDAMAEMSANDPVKAMLEDVRVILEATDTELKENSLEDLEMYCEDLDLAKDFHKLGGYDLLLQVLSSEHPSLRWRTASLLATLVQNNPYCQSAAVQLKIMPVLLKRVDTDVDETVRIKALYAVSCLARDCPEALQQFLDADGFSVLMRAMQTDIQKLQIKAAFLLAALCLDQPKCKDTLCAMGMVEQLVALLQGEHSDFHEHLMRALLVLVEDQSQAVEECRRPELLLKETLRQRIAFLEGREESLEELDYSQKLLKVCFADSGSGSVDR